MALLYVLFGASDIAMTQVLTETMAVLFLVLVVYRLPRLGGVASRRAAAGDAFLCGLTGGLLALLLLSAVSAHSPAPISAYFAAQSQLAAHGRNVVNTILVDFRALDTLGEIVVLTLAGAGVFALLRLRPEGEPPR